MGSGLEALELDVGKVAGLGPIRLRPWNADDREAVLTAFHDPDIIRWTTQAPTPSAPLVHEWLQSRQDGWADGTVASWAVTGRPDGSPGAPEVVLGSVGLKRLDLATQDRPVVHTDVMYWITPEARGHGLAAAVAAYMANWAYATLALHRVELHHEVPNLASCRVAQRAGYALEGTLRKSYLTPDGWVDEHLHASVFPPKRSW